MRSPLTLIAASPIAAARYPILPKEKLSTELQGSRGRRRALVDAVRSGRLRHQVGAGLGFEQALSGRAQRQADGGGGAGGRGRARGGGRGPAAPGGPAAPRRT